MERAVERVDLRKGGGALGALRGGAGPQRRMDGWRMDGVAPEDIPPSASLCLLPGFQDSPRCHEASVIFNLLRLLTWDLKLVAHSGPCL